MASMFNAICFSLRNSLSFSDNTPLSIFGNQVIWHGCSFQGVFEGVILTDVAAFFIASASDIPITLSSHDTADIVLFFIYSRLALSPVVPFDFLTFYNLAVFFIAFPNEDDVRFKVDPEVMDSVACSFTEQICILDFISY